MDAMVINCARKWGPRCRFPLTEDFLQDAALAVHQGKSPVDGIKWAWKRWTFGKGGHKRLAFDKPIFVGEPRESELTCESIETSIADRELIVKIAQQVSAEARAIMRSNLIGEPCVWRPALKRELREAAQSLVRTE